MQIASHRKDKGNVCLASALWKGKCFDKMLDIMKSSNLDEEPDIL